MSTFSKIINGLAMLDPEYARDAREDKRMERQAIIQSDRDVTLNDLQMKRDKYLADLQRTRDAQLHGNDMEKQAAQLNAERSLAEYTAAQTAARQVSAQTWQSGERRAGETFTTGRDSKMSRRRIKEAKAESDIAVGQEDRIAKNKTARRLNDLSSLLPDGMSPETKESTVKGLDKILSIDLPRARAENEIKNPGAYTPYGWRFEPAANRDWNAERGKAGLDEPGKLGMTIQDLMRGGVPQTDGQDSVLTRRGGRQLLESIAPSLNMYGD